MALQTGRLCRPSACAAVASPGFGHVNSSLLQRGKTTAERGANMFALWWRIKNLPGVSQTSLPFPLVACEQCTLHALSRIQVTFFIATRAGTAGDKSNCLRRAGMTSGT